MGTADRDAVDGLTSADLDLTAAADWEMSFPERFAFLSLVRAVRPDWAIEIGTAGGGSLAVLDRFVPWVVSIDIDRACGQRLAGAHPDVDFRVGRSHELLAPALDEARERGGRGLVLVDGDHTAEGVTSDVRAILAESPLDDLVIVLHDTAMPATRSALDAIDWWACPWVHHVHLDTVPPVTPGEGGLGVVALAPGPRSEREPTADAVPRSGSANWQPNVPASVRLRIQIDRLRRRLHARRRRSR